MCEHAVTDLSFNEFTKKPSEYAIINLFETEIEDHETTETTETKKETLFENRARKHNIITGDDSYDYSNNVIIFNARCEFTGIHWHYITFTIIKNGTIVTETEHSAFTDGSLTYPNYETFLCSKLSYFEEHMSEYDIYIDEKILDKKTFYDDEHCENY